MQTLISCVGDTDPIRNFHDGPLLHIARVLKPEKIILIHSERSKKKHEYISLALQSIPNYSPTIVEENTVLANNEVFLFDRMYEVLSGIIKKYTQTEETLLLNLTSATPQIISAMFSINRINDLKVRAFQVTTPVRDSNEGILHDNQEDLQLLIDTNEDNTEPFMNRLVEDNGEKFNESLVRRTVTDLIRSYEYSGAYDICKRTTFSVESQKKLNERLKEIIHSIKYQKKLSDVEKLKYDQDIKTLLNAYLIIDLQVRRDLVAESLIRMKNFAEFAAILYLKENYKNMIQLRSARNTYHLMEGKHSDELLAVLKAKAEANRNTFSVNQPLNLPVLIEILQYKEPDSPLERYLQRINAINRLRNKVAHGFEEIDSKEVNLPELLSTCRQILELVKTIDSKWYRYNDDLNIELLDYLK